MADQTVKDPFGNRKSDKDQDRLPQGRRVPQYPQAFLGEKHAEAYPALSSRTIFDPRPMTEDR